MRILVVGDSYMPTEVFRRGLAEIEARHDVRYLQVDESVALQPRTASESTIREFAGSPRELEEPLHDREVLVLHGAPVTAEVLEAAPGLRLIACARGGPVNIDIAAATGRGVAVVTTPGKNAEAVAELALAFMIMLARGLPAAQAAPPLSPGASAFEGAEYFGRELGGRRLGLVGFGQVARALATRATGIGMRVAAFDPFQAIDQPGVESCDALIDLLAASDVVSLHARATGDNADLMSSPQFAAMREGSLFLNTARETLVDERALALALRSGRLGGAALDVLRTDGSGQGNVLRGLPNVVITPHVGGATFETLDRGVAMVAQELDRFERGEPLRNLANPAVVAA